MNTHPQDERLLTAPVVALTGFMGAGKSTIGCALSSLLNWSFVDLDCEVERRSQLAIHEIFARHGEARFRELESEALHSALAAADAPTVIALGGGTFVQPHNAELLRAREAQVVFLELKLEQLLQRCRAMSHGAANLRPLATDEDAFCALYERRLPWYRKAELTVHTHDKTAEQVAREIAAALGFLRS